LIQVRNITRNLVLAEAVREAHTYFARLKGLIGAKELSSGEGIWICPCNSIHSFGMRFTFDAVFLDGENRVEGLYKNFRKNRLSRIFWKARGVLELPAGTIERTGTEVGDEVELRI
jgi:uncharacterized membrane protein (UPF0127 family)